MVQAVGCWLWSGQTIWFSNVPLLPSHCPSIDLQLGPNGLKPVPAGEVRVHWILPTDLAGAEMDLMYQDPLRGAIAESMQAVCAALVQESEAVGSGKHVLVRHSKAAGCTPASLLPVFATCGSPLLQACKDLASLSPSKSRVSAHNLQKHGFHLILTPQEDCQAYAVHGDAVVMTAGMVQACLDCTARGEHNDLPAAIAALQYVLAHELAHIHLNHRVSSSPCAFSGTASLPRLRYHAPTFVQDGMVTAVNLSRAAGRDAPVCGNAGRR